MLQCPAKSDVPEGVCATLGAKKSEITVTVMIEIPQGSRNKYEYDKKSRLSLAA